MGEFSCYFALNTLVFCKTLRGCWDSHILELKTT